MLPLALCASLIPLPDTLPVVNWSFAATPVVEGRFTVELTATVADGWHIYATRLENDLGPIPTTIRFTPSESFVLHADLEEPAPEEVFDPNFEMQVRYHSGAPRFVQPMTTKSTTSFQLSGEVEYMVCNDKTCLPPVAIPFMVEVTWRDTKN
jgi:thiol:disulfide interchange protein DsbD